MKIHTSLISDINNFSSNSTINIMAAFLLKSDNSSTSTLSMIITRLRIFTRNHIFENVASRILKIVLHTVHHRKDILNILCTFFYIVCVLLCIWKSAWILSSTHRVQKGKQTSTHRLNSRALKSLDNLLEQRLTWLINSNWPVKGVLKMLVLR